MTDNARANALLRQAVNGPRTRPKDPEPPSEPTGSTDAKAGSNTPPPPPTPPTAAELFRLMAGH